MSNAADDGSAQVAAPASRINQAFAQLARGRVDAASTYVLQIISLGLGFVSQLAVARLAGISGYGVYAYALAWSSIIVQPSLLGFDRLLVREVATYQKAGEFGLLRGLLRRSNQVALLGAGALTLIMAAIAIPVSSPAVRISVAMGMLTIPVATLGRVRLATLQALRRAALGQLTQSVGRTAYFLVFLGIAVVISRSTPMPPELAIAAQAFAFGAALASGSIAVRRVLPRQVMRSTPQFEGRKWARSLPMLSLFSILTIMSSQIPIIMLGAIGTTGDTGRFNASWQSISLITIALMSVGQVSLPAFPFFPLLTIGQASSDYSVRRLTPRRRLRSRPRSSSRSSDRGSSVCSGTAFDRAARLSSSSWRVRCSTRPRECPAWRC
jgi:O-antigen/teichoic acid export membrane protein